MLLLDLLEYAATPCPWRFRSMGFLTSSLQVQARYRRCRRAWEAHLGRTRRFILEAAELAPARRTALILGAGLLHDIPLRELAAGFQQVLLVDLVFPWSSRLTAARYSNVRCLTGDVTETLHLLPQAARHPNVPLPLSQPSRFLHHPTLDLTVSVNLLSQLPVIPTRYLQRRHPEAESTHENWARQLQRAHLAYLRQLPGHTALVTDTVGFHRTSAGALTSQWDNLHGLTMPQPSETWEWNLAPAPEAYPDVDHLVRIAAYRDWKRALGPATVVEEHL